MIGIEAALTGITTRDCVAKISGKGRAYVQLNLKITNGEEAQFVNVLAFDVSVIEAAKAGLITKGTQVYAEGRLQVGTWTGDDGRNRLELKMLARYAMVPEIGRRKPKKARKKASAPSVSAGTVSIVPDPDLNDELPAFMHGGAQ